MAAPAIAAHDKGEKIELHGASRDGRYVLVSWTDVNRDDVKLGLHDVAKGKLILTKRVAPVRLKKAVRAVRRAHRLRRLPRERQCHRRRDVCAFYYDWWHVDGARSRAVALVGPLGRRVSNPVRLPCYSDKAECVTQARAASTPVKAYWFGRRTVLIAETWLVKASYGHTYVPIFVHRKLPGPSPVPAKPPQRGVK